MRDRDGLEFAVGDTVRPPDGTPDLVVEGASDGPWIAEMTTGERIAVIRAGEGMSGKRVYRADEVKVVSFTMRDADIKPKAGAKKAKKAAVAEEGAPPPPPHEPIEAPLRDATEDIDATSGERVRKAVVDATLVWGE